MAHSLVLVPRPLFPETQSSSSFQNTPAGLFENRLERISLQRNYPDQLLIRTAANNTVNQLELEHKYRKLPAISPGLIFVQKAFLVGLFSGELIFGATYYWSELCVSKRGWA